MGVFGPELVTGNANFWADLPEIILALAAIVFTLAFIVIVPVVGRVLYAPPLPLREVRGTGLKGHEQTPQA